LGLSVFYIKLNSIAELLDALQRIGKLTSQTQNSERYIFNFLEKKAALESIDVKNPPKVLALAYFSPIYVAPHLQR
jgi:hypothetical protein